MDQLFPILLVVLIIVIILGLLKILIKLGIKIFACGLLVILLAALAIIFLGAGDFTGF